MKYVQVDIFKVLCYLTKSPKTKDVLFTIIEDQKTSKYSYLRSHNQWFLFGIHAHVNDKQKGCQLIFCHLTNQLTV